MSKVTSGGDQSEQSLCLRGRILLRMLPLLRALRVLFDGPKGQPIRHSESLSPVIVCLYQNTDSPLGENADLLIETTCLTS